LTAGARADSIQCAMSQPSHIYASTVRRRRPLWPFAVAVLALVVAALAAAVLL
jgi:hypothetical protein